MTEKEKKTMERPPVFRGWISTDEDEIKRREWRGRAEIQEVQALDSRLLGDYRVISSSGGSYTAEIRSLRERINSCECQDYRTNRLGTCKHVEGVLHRLRNGNARPAEANDRIEVFLDEAAGQVPKMTVPKAIADPVLLQEAERLFPHVSRGSPKALRGLRQLAQGNADGLRVSRRLDSWVALREAANRRHRERARFAKDLEAGRRSLDFLKMPLLPYQVEGALHLAFGERALLADDMGLGKTVQAIAACALLRQMRGISRVLVISPASLKAEWEEQIARFSDLPSKIVYGNRLARRKIYADPAFFTLSNYEQIVVDGGELLDMLRPDVVILDEAQRIKNWQTKTANAVKRLRSRYAFVLTGTPLENRIDEVYSIVQFLDPELLGPLFRFNREFYRLDEKGRPEGFQNLEELANRISSVMLRRRKEDVEGQLPGRATKTFFVPMTESQTDLYADYEYRVRRLAAQARKRPLAKEEYERLQRYLACMRMICDTTYILGDDSGDCPKLEEIERLFPDLLEDPQRKIIVFSEWVRMLELVRSYAVENGIDFAWHTGAVPQQRRRAEIHRFREDPECRLFLSSESGGVGLNLQVADTVINMDQPWNPARLEQRVARAWRKHQTRAVKVINLVTENSIESRMLTLLDAKRALAEGVLDRRGDLSEIRLPSSRAAFMERLEAVLGPGKDDAPVEPSPLDRLRDDLAAGHGAALRRILARDDTVLVVIALPPSRRAAEESRLSEMTGLRVSVIDPDTHETMLRLMQSGLVAMPTENLREVYPGPGGAGGPDGRGLRMKMLAERAEHKLKAAALLEGGGFAEEARTPIVEAARLATAALAALRGETEPDDAEAAAEYLMLKAPEELPPDAMRILSGDGAAAVAPVRSFLERISGMPAG